eukprot:766587-Pyramimonas_sp.AAC.1
MRVGVGGDARPRSTPEAPPSSVKWRFSDFLDGLRITFLCNEFLSLAKTQVRTPAALANRMWGGSIGSQLGPIECGEGAYNRSLDQSDEGRSIGSQLGPIG